MKVLLAIDDSPCSLTQAALRRTAKHSPLPVAAEDRRRPRITVSSFWRPEHTTHSRSEALCGTPCDRSFGGAAAGLTFV